MIEETPTAKVILERYRAFLGNTNDDRLTAAILTHTEIMLIGIKEIINILEEKNESIRSSKSN